MNETQMLGEKCKAIIDSELRPRSAEPTMYACWSL